MKLTATVCELCHDQPPSLYCSSDSAFLCSDCDFQVHAANFIVARHIRLTLSCSICKSFTGQHSSSTPLICTSCYTAHDDALSSSSSSSSCISSTTKTTSKTTTSVSSSSGNQVMSDWKTRDVLLNWCTRLGVIGSRCVIEVATQAFEVSCLDRSVLPYRVALTASLWFSLSRFTKEEDDKKKMRARLKRLEEISGVPAKSIVVAASKLSSMLKMMKHRRLHPRHQDAVEEGWAENGS